MAKCKNGCDAPVPGMAGFVGTDGVVYVAVKQQFTSTPLAGVGTPGYNAGAWQCALFRSPTGELYYLDQSEGEAGRLCRAVDGQAMCDASRPVGLWTRPLQLINVPVTVGDPTNIVNWESYELFDPRHAVIQALSFIQVLDSALQTEIDPTNLWIGGWSPGANSQLITGWGKSSTPPYIPTQEMQNIPYPITMFTEQVLVDAQNNLPNVMASVDLKSSENGFGFRIRNLKTVSVDLFVKVYVNYLMGGRHTSPDRGLEIQAQRV